MHEQMEFDFVTYPKYLEEQKAKEEIKPGPADKKMKQEEKAKALKEGRTSKAATDKKVGDSNIPCPAAQKAIKALPAPNPVAQLPAPCRFGTLTITKEKRKFDLLVTESVVPPMAIPVLEIVAGHSKNPAEVICNLSGLGGPCNSHNNKIFDFSGATIENSNSKLKFSAFSKRALSWNVLKLFDKPAINSYYVSASTCEIKKYVALIKVYPDINVKANINLPSFKFSRSLTGNSDSDKEKNYEKSWSFGIGGSITEDGVGVDLSAEYSEVINKIKDAKETLDKVVGVVQNLTEGPDVSLEFEIMRKKYELEFQWKEIEGQYRVDSEYKHLLSLDPLIACNFKIDILGPVLKSNPVGRAVLAAKKVAEWIVRQELNIKLQIIIGGKVGGKIEVVKVAGNSNSKSEISPNPPEISIELKGIVETKGEGWGVYAGAEIGTEPMVFKPIFKSPVKKDGKEFFELSLDFSGVKVKGSFYIMYGRKQVEKKDNPGEFDQGSKAGPGLSLEIIKRGEPFHIFSYQLK